MSAISLQMPTSYVELEKEEMEYVDGGGSVSLYISKSTLSYAIQVFGWGAGSFLGAIAGGYLAGPIGAKLGQKIGGVLGGFIGSSISGMIAKSYVTNGVTVRYNNVLIPGNYNYNI